MPITGFEPANARSTNEWRTKLPYVTMMTFRTMSNEMVLKPRSNLTRLKLQITVVAQKLTTTTKLIYVALLFLSQEHYSIFLEYNLSILMVNAFLTMASKLYPVF